MFIFIYMFSKWENFSDFSFIISHAIFNDYRMMERMKLFQEVTLWLLELPFGITPLNIILMTGQVILLKLPGNWKGKELTWTTTVFWFFRFDTYYAGIVVWNKMFVSTCCNICFLAVARVKLSKFHWWSQKLRDPMMKVFLNILRT